MGVNKYQEEEKDEKSTLELGHRYQVREEIIIQRVKKFKEERNNNKVRDALVRVKDVALDKHDEVTPALIQAAGEGATLGEMCGVLKEVFDWKVW